VRCPGASHCVLTPCRTLLIPGHERQSGHPERRRMKGGSDAQSRSRRHSRDQRRRQCPCGAVADRPLGYAGKCQNRNAWRRKADSANSKSTTVRPPVGGSPVRLHECRRQRIGGLMSPLHSTSARLGSGHPTVLMFVAVVLGIRSESGYREMSTRAPQPRS